MRSNSHPARYSPTSLYPMACMVGLATIGIGSLAPNAIAQNADVRLIAAQQATQRYSFRYVNPTTGNDANPGTQDAPLRTIARALATAPENTIVVLAPGTYNAASGEQFPLQMKSGVTLQGEPTNQPVKMSPYSARTAPDYAASPSATLPPKATDSGLSPPVQ
jgi:hypothetical protein